MINILLNDMTVQPKLNVNHMENLGDMKKFTNNTYELKVEKDLITYYHKCYVSPLVLTWIQAIKNGNFFTWLGLTAHDVRTHLPKSMAIAKGHI